MEVEVLRALTEGSLRARLQRRLGGGLTVTQVLDRLPVPPPSDAENPTVARRQQIEAVALALDTLVDEGRVARKRVKLKNAMVDVYRALP